jgi:hypothetical protein
MSFVIVPVISPAVLRPALRLRTLEGHGAADSPVESTSSADYDLLVMTLVAHDDDSVTEENPMAATYTHTLQDGPDLPAIWVVASDLRTAELSVGAMNVEKTTLLTVADLPNPRSARTGYQT